MGTSTNINTATYGTRSNGEAHGDVFTSVETVQFMLDEVGYTSDKDLSLIKLLEPSCGEGDFFVEICRRLHKSSLNYGFNYQKAAIKNLCAYDIDQLKIATCIKRIQSTECHIDGIELIFRCEDFLTASIEEKFDVIVGNPPYVRYENIPQNLIELYRTLFSTFHYRSDLYVPFYEKTLKCLSGKGKHCFICSNRWLKNEYGKKLRSFISKKFFLMKIWDMESVKPFKTEVGAYTSITIISTRRNLGQCEIYKVYDLEKIQDSPCIRKCSVPVSDDWTKLFTDKGGSSITSLGFSIGIGVATGADKIFISKDLPHFVENDLLLPAISSADLRDNTFVWDGKYLLNVFTENGKLIDLSDYPRAESYLNMHGETLRSRHVAKKKASSWYRTIDKVDASLRIKPKILLPDMSANTYIFVDDGKYYPLHNIYYITGKSYFDLTVLAAILMSESVKTQLLEITTCMSGGFPRWQSQHLKKILLPNVFDDNELMRSLSIAYLNRDISTINSIVDDATINDRSNTASSEQIQFTLDL